MSNSHNTSKLSSKDIPINDQFKALLNTLGSFKSQISMLNAQVKTIERSINKEMKKLQKAAQKNKNKETEKLPDLLFLVKFPMTYVNLWVNQKGLKWLEPKSPNISFTTSKPKIFPIKRTKRLSTPTMP